MKKQIISNLLSSGVEKFVVIGIQFISSIILIRMLPRDDYGIMGIVAGYFTFVNIVNISLESIILRDHKKFDSDLQKVMQDFFGFNLLKSAFIIMVALCLSAFLTSIYDNSGFVYAIWSITLITVADSLTAPFAIYFASKFNQKLVTKISVLRSVFGLLILLGLFAYPYLWFVALKDLIISMLFVGTWFYLAVNKLGFRPEVEKPDFSFIGHIFFTYSFWTHLNGIVTSFIYKSDTFFLSLFVSLAMVGDYNIALNSANIANILPMIIGYQNSVALSHARDKAHALKLSNAFLRLSLLIGAITLAGFYGLGEYYLYIVTGTYENNQIFFYMMCIVGGLVLVKTFASPLVSYIAIHGSIQKMVIQVSLPMALVTMTAYFISAAYFQTQGVAVANLLVASVWLLLLGVYLETMENHFIKKLLWGAK
ncbi:oligosaccharide flippase family protein [Sulfurimonas sp. HSL-3221]|uniref:lipopolysaccharide biosynthesis protein n=1 Tax=Sulfurimonadaceae TaxID=2771471 RepID=UPI001E51B0B4|nr:oligosaccharide flippase family protein [Sulfurimonas sp. HSL-3221]UFS62408.1 oligosaccharide flippase family protein [Sulfurimonas sp. HSL-3221]